jgi:hypothetical protein
MTWLVEIADNQTNQTDGRSVYMPAESMEALNPGAGVTVSYAGLFKTKKAAQAEADRRGVRVREILKKWW